MYNTVDSENNSILLNFSDREILVQRYYILCLTGVKNQKEP